MLDALRPLVDDMERAYQLFSFHSELLVRGAMDTR